MMDRALKERIIGAAVLVLVVVLVVPVFLDGPSNDGEVVRENSAGHLTGQSACRCQASRTRKSRPLCLSAIAAARYLLMVALNP